MKSIFDCLLYTFVDSAYLAGREATEDCRQLCEGGSDLIQLRAKDWPAARIGEVAGDLRRITREHDVALVINDYLEIARGVGADFCHLGQEDFFDSGHVHVSELRPPMIGISTHAPAQAQRAVDAGADYIAIGPIFPTGTKPAAKPVTLEYVRWAAGNIRIPWFAIGGINLQNLDDVLTAGAKRICVVSAILTAPDIAAECKKFRERLSSVRV
jgi:thiamine-phosphate pyrophosphorylase